MDLQFKPLRLDGSSIPLRTLLQIGTGVAAPVIAAAARVLAPGGLLAFTVESHAGDGVKLLPTLRFAHGEACLREAIAAAGLTLLKLAEAAIRTEKGIPVSGLVVVAKRHT